MKILEMNLKVDKLPDGCSVAKESDESCIFNCFKYCILKQALHQGNYFVQNNRGVVPEDCPLRRSNIN